MWLFGPCGPLSREQASPREDLAQLAGLPAAERDRRSFRIADDDPVAVKTCPNDGTDPDNDVTQVEPFLKLFASMVLVVPVIFLFNRDSEVF